MIYTKHRTMTRRIIIFIISWLTCVILWCPITTAAATPSFDNEHDEHEEAANQQQQQQQQGRRHSSLRRLRHTRSANNGQTRARDLNHEVLADNIDIDGTTRVMVQCQDWTMAKCLDEILNLLPSAVIMHQLDVLNSIAIQLPATFNTININSIMADFPFEMQPDPIREPLVLPHSLRILQQEDQEYLQTQQVIPYGLELLAVPQVWSKTRGADVTVCIMDTGLDLPHPDLSSDRLSGSDSNDVVRPWTQDAAGHGTHVAGTIGASDNGVGVLGVAPDADLFIVRVFNYNGVFRGSDVIAAAEQCRVGGATVINMSLGGTSPVSNEAKLFQRYLEQEGIVAVAAAGNSGHQGNAANYPAGYPSVLSVAAVDYQGQVAHFSTRNNQVNVAAPGVAVLSTYKNGQYAKLSGTSMASPHVAGVVALLQSVKPQATPMEIWELLTTTASLSLGGGNSNNGNNGNGNSNSRTPEMGYGIVNVQAAMDVWFPPPQEEEEEVVVTNPPTTTATDPPTTSPPATPVCGAGEQSFVISITTDYYGYVGDYRHLLVNVSLGIVWTCLCVSSFCLIYLLHFPLILSLFSLVPFTTFSTSYSSSDTEWELETIIAGTSQGQGQGRDQVVVLKGGPYPDAAFDDYVGQACVQADNLCYKITVYDVFGDGYVTNRTESVQLCSSICSTVT